MLAIIILFAGFACAMISRILVLTAAFGVSTGWGLTVLLVPFGPLFFRWSYPDLCLRARPFRIATLVCFVAGGAGLGSSPLDMIRSKVKSPFSGFVTSSNAETEAKDSVIAAPATPAPAVAAATAKGGGPEDFAKLQDWYAQLNVKRKNLLKADKAGLEAFNAEAAQYQAAMQAYKAHKPLPSTATANNAATANPAPVNAIQPISQPTPVKSTFATAAP